MKPFLKHFSSIRNFQLRGLDEPTQVILNKFTSLFKDKDDLVAYNAQYYDYLDEQGVIVSLKNEIVVANNLATLDLLANLAEIGVNLENILELTDERKLKRLLPTGLKLNEINSIIELSAREELESIDTYKNIVRVDFNSRFNDLSVERTARNIKELLPEAKINESVKDVLDLQIKSIRDHYAEKTIAGLDVKL